MAVGRGLGATPGPGGSMRQLGCEPSERAPWSWALRVLQRGVTGCWTLNLSAVAGTDKVLGVGSVNEQARGGELLL